MYHMGISIGDNPQARAWVFGRQERRH